MTCLECGTQGKCLRLIRYNSKLVRQSFSLIFLFFILVYMAIVIYAPSVAIASVLGVDKWMLILVSTALLIAVAEKIIAGFPF